MSTNIIITDLENAWTAVKNWIEANDTWLVSLIKAEISLDRQLLIKDLSDDLTTFGQSVQSNNGGINAKELGSELLASIEGQFAIQAGAMLWQDVMLAVSTALTNLNPPAVQGNGGNLTGGVQSGS